MNWYVGYTGINQEPLARRGLQDGDFEVYLPMGSKVVRHARKAEVRVFPVFSRYIFVNFDPNPECLAAVRSTDGIIDILTNNWLPMEIPDWIIEGIKEREIAGVFDQKPPIEMKIRKWSKSFSILKSLLDPNTKVQIL